MPYFPNLSNLYYFVNFKQKPYQASFPPLFPHFLPLSYHFKCFVRQVLLRSMLYLRILIKLLLFFFLKRAPEKVFVTIIFRIFVVYKLAKVVLKDPYCKIKNQQLKNILRIVRSDGGSWIKTSVLLFFCSPFIVNQYL
jgi:hypothetical protein